MKSLYVHQHATRTAFSSSESWVILSPIEESIRRKIEAVGTPLKEWDISIYRGVLTGYNEAFIISTAKRDEILANCQTEEERQRTEALIRPILRGKDIKRYSYDWAGLWLINTHNGVKGELPPIDITLYPAIKAHLDSHWDRIARRSDQGITPYNLRDCAYIKDFEKPKIIWKIIGSRLAFTIDINGIMVNNACYIMTGDSLMHILGFLNSAPLIWYSEITNMNKTGVGDAQVGAQNIKLFPVPINPNKEIERLVEQLLSNPTDDNARQLLSERIDSIYGLTKEERHYLELLNL